MNVPPADIIHSSDGPIYLVQCRSLFRPKYQSVGVAAARRWRESV